MIESMIDHKGFSYKQIYFSNDCENILRFQQFDIIRVYQHQKKCHKINEFYTLFTNLERNIDEIKKDFSKTIRQEINRSIKKDNIDVVIIDNPSEDELLELLNDYETFKDFKGLSTDTEYMKKSFFAIRENIIIFKVKYNNKNLIYNSYIVDEERAKLKTSTSIRNIDDKEIINLVSRSNKRLHLVAMEYFKNKSIKIYDWGGVDKDILTGVSKFKKSFGGEYIVEYEGLIINKKIIKLKYLIQENGLLGVIYKIYDKFLEKVKGV